METTNEIIHEAASINLPYIILALFMAIASGILGSFAIMRKMALASDPISHIALPGIALAVLAGINPVIGAASALILGAIIVWSLEKRSGISTEVMIGVIFSLALAVGAIIAVDEHLIEELLGGHQAIGLAEFVIGLLSSLSIISFLLIKRNELTLAILSPELAKTSGLNIDRINFYFLIVFVITILLGLNYLGVLLMGSLIIIPAAIGKQLARSFWGMILTSSAASVLSTAIGLALSFKMEWEPGPGIIIVAGSLFFVSLLAKQKD